MKKFFAEFKKFITRGNVVDMAVGVIVGGAFTAIVNGLSNFILKPVVNWVISLFLGKDSLSEMLTFLVRVDTTEEILDDAGNVIGTAIVPDLTESIYIDWGSFINAVINFFLIAIVLFLIVKFINNARDDKDRFGLSKADRAELKKRGIKRRNKAAVAAYLNEKAAAEAKAAEEAAEKARLEKLANPTTEELLKQILAEMQKAK